MNLVKADLVEKLRKDFKLSHKLCTEFVEQLFISIKSKLIAGSAVQISGFGEFYVFQTAERDNARNPKTGEGHSVPAKITVKFHAGPKLETILN